MIFNIKKINNNHFNKKYENYYKTLKTEEEKEIAKKLIEKMAIWYELRYPYYFIYGLLDSRKYGKEFANEAMFKNNQYVNILLGENSDIKDLDWDEFYNAHAFISSLKTSEKDFFNTNNIDKHDYLTLYMSHSSGGVGFYIWVSRSGYIHIPEDVTRYSKEIHNENIEEKVIHVKDIYKFIEEFNKTHENLTLDLSDSDDEKIDEKIYRMDRKDGLLDCVMYKIISRRDKEDPQIGAYRAFMFAKEFNRDINIPIKYAFDNESYISSQRRRFIREFLECGGSQDINYYNGENYNKEEPLLKIINAIEKQKEETIEYLRKREELTELQELRQRLVNALQTKVENTATKEEKKLIAKIDRNKSRK